MVALNDTFAFAPCFITFSVGSSSKSNCLTDRKSPTLPHAMHDHTGRNRGRMVYGRMGTLFSYHFFLGTRNPGVTLHIKLPIIIDEIDLHDDHQVKNK
jgi:hypothetical protein